MRINTSYVQKCKTVAHIFQAILIFIAGCITIAVLTKGGETGGATRYYFALCFLSAPAVIYLTMVPMWSRAARFANAYAFLTLDALYTILWLAAFSSVAWWNAKGVNEGAEEKKLGDDDPKNCTVFKFGPEAKCNLSRVTVGFGVVIFIFFILTTAISGYYANKFRKEGVLPYESAQQDSHHFSGDASKDNAWSTEIDQHEGHDSDEDDRRTERGGNQEEDEYALLHSTETEDGRHPGRPLSWGDDHRMGGGYAPAAQDDGPLQMPYAAYGEEHSAVSPSGYEQYRREAQPGGAKRDSSYGGSGYSFGGR